jgi:LemA protein
MKKGLLVGVGLIAALVGLFLVVLLWGVGVNNKVVKLNLATDAQWAQVQNVYQRRADLIPNLVNTVKGAANFEKGTLENVVQARASVGQVKLDPNRAPDDPKQLQQFQAAQDGLSSALSRLLMVVESYPELKANRNFLELQTQIEGTENRVANERRVFNDKVKDYNTYIQQVPGTLIASFRNFRPKPYFEATAGAERPPQVQFDFGNSKTNR